MRMCTSGWGHACALAGGARRGCAGEGGTAVVAKVRLDAQRADTWLTQYSKDGPTAASGAWVLLLAYV